VAVYIEGCSVGDCWIEYSYVSNLLNSFIDASRAREVESEAELSVNSGY
jgi:hypothetical protein